MKIEVYVDVFLYILVGGLSIVFYINFFLYILNEYDLYMNFFSKV